VFLHTASALTCAKHGRSRWRWRLALAAISHFTFHVSIFWGVYCAIARVPSSNSPRVEGSARRLSIMGAFNFPIPLFLFHFSCWLLRATLMMTVVQARRGTCSRLGSSLSRWVSSRLRPMHAVPPLPSIHCCPAGSLPSSSLPFTHSLPCVCPPSSTLFAHPAPLPFYYHGSLSLYYFVSPYLYHFAFPFVIQPRFLLSPPPL
jgi:hypothetical protein